MPTSSVPNTRRRKRGERLGQQREQRDAEQRADGVADQPRHEARADGVVEEEKRGGDEQARRSCPGGSARGPSPEVTRQHSSGSSSGHFAPRTPRSTRAPRSLLVREIAAARAHAVGALAQLDADGVPPAVLCAASRCNRGSTAGSVRPAMLAVAGSRSRGPADDLGPPAAVVGHVAQRHDVHAVVAPHLPRAAEDLAAAVPAARNRANRAAAGHRETESGSADRVAGGHGRRRCAAAARDCRRRCRWRTRAPRSRG